MVYKSHHEWDDAEWLERRRGAEHVNAPVSIYEVHLGSWRLKPGEGNRCLSYVELADELSDRGRDGSSLLARPASRTDPSVHC